MPATIKERFDSRPANLSENPSIDLVYIVIDAESDTEVISLVGGESPDDYLGLDRDAVRTEPLGGGVWTATVRYTRRGNPSDFEFDTSGGTQRIASSLGTQQRVAVPGFVAPNYGGAINVRDDRVEGTDVTVPVFSFSETHYYDQGLVTQPFKYLIFQLTGRVNSAGFKGFATGEVLFLGASGKRSGQDQWGITYKFAASPNIVGQPIGPGGLSVSKLGWEYLWVRFEDVVNDNTLVKQPVAYYVEQVYPYADLTQLGLGA